MPGIRLPGLVLGVLTSLAEPLIGHSGSMRVRRVSRRVRALKPAQIADLLEDAAAADCCSICR